MAVSGVTCLALATCPIPRKRERGGQLEASEVMRGPSQLKLCGAAGVAAGTRCPFSWQLCVAAGVPALRTGVWILPGVVSVSGLSTIMVS